MSLEVLLKHMCFYKYIHGAFIDTDNHINNSSSRKEPTDDLTKDWYDITLDLNEILERSTEGFFLVSDTNTLDLFNMETKPCAEEDKPTALNFTKPLPPAYNSTPYQNPSIKRKKSDKYKASYKKTLKIDQTCKYLGKDCNGAMVDDKYCKTYSDEQEFNQDTASFGTNQKSFVEDNKYNEIIAGNGASIYDNMNVENKVEETSLVETLDDKTIEPIRTLPMFSNNEKKHLDDRRLMNNIVDKSYINPINNTPIKFSNNSKSCEINSRLALEHRTYTRKLFPHFYDKTNAELIVPQRKYYLIFLNVCRSYSSLPLNYIENLKRTERFPYVSFSFAPGTNNKYTITYKIYNLPSFFTEIVLNRSTKINFIAPHIVCRNFIKGTSFSGTLEILKTDILYAEDFIPQISLLYNDPSFLTDYSKNVLQMKTSIYEFRSISTKPVLAKNMSFPVSKFDLIKTKNNTDSLNVLTFIQGVVGSELYNEVESDVISVVKQLLFIFSMHVQCIKRLSPKAKFLDIVNQFSYIIKEFQKYKLVIKTERIFTKEENKILSVYYKLVDHYIPFAKLIIDVYNLYFKKEYENIIVY
ncbi:hypothetical protein CDIK_2540 [Cucumispora dikerogammari]|nr:hypothetical protein CDIK_2540 [Cucumispora dikerogammari]